MELAFFLRVADRLGERPYDIVDVTERHTPSVVSIIPDEGLRVLLGSECPISVAERDEARRQWRRLKAENAPFRIVSEAGLISVPIDYFDPLLLERATTDWRKSARIVGDAMGYNMKPYLQVGDLMLLTRMSLSSKRASCWRTAIPGICRPAACDDRRQNRKGAPSGPPIHSRFGYDFCCWQAAADRPCAAAACWQSAID